MPGSYPPSDQNSKLAGFRDKAGRMEVRGKVYPCQHNAGAGLRPSHAHRDGFSIDEHTENTSIEMMGKMFQRPWSQLSPCKLINCKRIAKTGHTCRDLRGWLRLLPHLGSTILIMAETEADTHLQVFF